MFRINPSNLSGSMDIIASEDCNGDVRSTEFHFRVGKLKMINCNLKKGSLFVNDKEV